MISSIRIPLRTYSHTYFKKVGTRNAQAISKIVLAGVLNLQKGKVSHFRIGLGSVAPIPTRARGVEKIVDGQKIDESLIVQVLNRLKSEVTPIDDIRSTSYYRMRVLENCVREFLESAL